MITTMQRITTQPPVWVEVIYYNCKECDNPIFNPEERKRGVCALCFFNKKHPQEEE